MQTNSSFVTSTSIEQQCFKLEERQLIKKNYQSCGTGNEDFGGLFEA